MVNLETEVKVVDFVSESLEALGNDLTVARGAVYDTAEFSLAGFDLGKDPADLPAEKFLAAIRQYSSPSITMTQPAIYIVLNVCFTSPSLPYSQVLDVNRSYLCHIGSDRFDTMRHFPSIHNGISNGFGPRAS
jgi:hypothetical protein